jgi:peptidoglycan-N-acetylglucosamine deacetylase
MTPPPASPRPPATFAVRASWALHLGAVAAVVARPRLWPWMLGAVVADHLLLTAAGLWPRSKLLGPNWTRLPAPSAARACVALTIDDGPDPEVTPAVLNVLDRYSAKATFFCIGERVAQYPQLAREIVERGHAIENHSQRHLHRFSVLGPRAMASEICQAQQTITDVTGQPPRFFRAPAGLRNPFLQPVLSRLGLQLASWSRRGFDTVNADPETVFARLIRGLAGGDILLLHDGHAARSRTGTPIVLEVLPRLLEGIDAARLTPITLRAAYQP